MSEVSHHPLQPAFDAILAAREALATGQGPLNQLPDAVDTLLRETVSTEAPTRGWVLLALGGYGRQEMAPLSDIDLLFLVDEPQRHPWIAPCLHTWWDLGLKLGYATRDIEETVALAKRDHKTAMALLEMRPVAGEPSRAEALRAKLRCDIYTPKRQHLIAAIAAERGQRHARHGDTVYLLEPDLKSGEGGLRDLHGARWASLLVRNRSALDGVGLTSAEVTELAQAHEALRRQRCVLHGVAKRRVSRLRFEYQEAFSERLGAADVEAGVQRYWQAADRVRAYTRRALDVFCETVGLPIGARVEGQGPLNPAQAMAAFRQSAEAYLPLSPALTTATAAAARAMTDTDRRDPALIRDFFAILTHPGDRARALRSLHDVGLLSALIPEFQCLAGRYQHNVFHVYTVDVHTLEGIAELKRLASGVGPNRPVEVMTDLPNEERRVLFLALLLHDLDKGGLDPSDAHTVAARLGLGPAACDQVEFLVREHLLLALLAQTRDIHDPKTVQHLCRECHDRWTLAMLYLLTWADMSSANPELLTQWKAQLLGALYHRADVRLAGGLGVYADPSKQVSRLRRALLERTLDHVPEHPTAQTRAVDRFISALPTRYAGVVGADAALKHMALLKRLKAADAVFALDPGPDQTGLVTAVAKDRPGLLCQLSAVFAAHGVEILNAEVFSRSDETVIDLFRVALPVPWEALAAGLDAVIQGQPIPEARLRGRERVSPLGERPAPPVPTEITIDNDASSTHSVVDVIARDRPGLLYRLTRGLHQIGLNIVLARITTEGDAARDAFYVAYLTGGKVVGRHRMAWVAERLRAAIDAPL